MDQQLVNRIVEAALLAAPQPLTAAQLQALFPEEEPAPEGAIDAALEQLRAACEGRGVELVEVASGWRYQVRGEVHPWVARLWNERRTKYTRATLETLALIAYRQPITRGEIEQVRGVAVSSNIVQALEEREWIRVVGHRDVPGRPALYGTTKAFLDYFGLKRLDELPPLSELKDFGELDPQLTLGKPESESISPEPSPDLQSRDEETEADPGSEASPDAELHHQELDSAPGSSPAADPEPEAEPEQAGRSPNHE
ncbi:MAG: SMC-Scp complex subunit ScpB [Pseudoxanthomonas sp.]